MEFSSLTTLEDVKKTTSSAANDENFVHYANISIQVFLVLLTRETAFLST